MLPSSKQGHVALEIQSSLTAFFRLGFSKFYIIHKSQILLLLKLRTLCYEVILNFTERIRDM